MNNYGKLSLLKNLKDTIRITQEYRKLLAANISLLNSYYISTVLGMLSIRVNSSLEYDPVKAKYDYGKVKNMIRDYLHKTYEEVHENFVMYPKDDEFLRVDMSYMADIGRTLMTVEIEVLLKPEDLPPELKGENCRIETKVTPENHYEYKCDIGGKK